MFRESLEFKLLNTNKKNNAGAKPYDVVLLFKILILQRYYGLGDSQVEYQILDRTNFKAFLDLETADKVPDEKTIWSFRERVEHVFGFMEQSMKGLTLKSIGIVKARITGLINLTYNLFRYEQIKRLKIIY